MEKEREQVLEMLSEGKISAEDARRLLEALEEPKELSSESEALSGEERREETAEKPAGDDAFEENGLPLSYCPPKPSGIPHGESAAPEELKALILSWISGPVELRCFEGEKVQVTEYSSRPLTQEEQMEVILREGTLEIRWCRQEALPFFGHKVPEKHLVIELPQSLSKSLKRISCSLVSGNFYSRGISAGNMEIRTVSGKIYGEDLSGERIQLRSVSGKVLGSGLRARALEASSTSGKTAISGFEAGSLCVHTVSGKIELRGNSETFDLRSTSGTIELDALCCPREGKFHTVSGKIRTAFPENEGFLVKYHTSSGRFESQYPIAGELGRKKGEGTYRLGGAQFHYHTASGAIRLERLLSENS